MAASALPSFKHIISAVTRWPTGNKHRAEYRNTDTSLLQFAFEKIGGLPPLLLSHASFSQREYYDRTGYEDSSAAAGSASQCYADDFDDIFNMFFG